MLMHKHLSESRSYLLILVIECKQAFLWRLKITRLEFASTVLHYRNQYCFCLLLWIGSFWFMYIKPESFDMSVGQVGMCPVSIWHRCAFSYAISFWLCSGNWYQRSGFPAVEPGAELSQRDRPSSSLLQYNDRLTSAQTPPTPPTRQLSEPSARFSYQLERLPLSLAESSIVPPEVARTQLQRDYSLHNDNLGLPANYPAVASGGAVHSVADYPSQYGYQHDRSSALARSFSNHTGFGETPAADQESSARVRSKTPGPDFLRGTRPDIGGEEESTFSDRPTVRSKTPTFESSNRVRSSLRNRPPMSGTPDFIPASQYTGPPRDGFNYPAGPNWASATAHQAVPKLSSSSMSSTLHGSPTTDSTAGVLGMKALNPMSSSWTDSPSSNFSEPRQHVPARDLHDEQYYEMPIYLRRLETGFGFRIIGGTEEGSQVGNILHVFTAPRSIVVSDVVFDFVQHLCSDYWSFYGTTELIVLYCIASCFSL